MLILFVSISIILLPLVTLTLPKQDETLSRKVLGSSVVTSVSVVMDHGSADKAVFSDAVGNSVAKPVKGSEIASPIELLNPDKYEFYTFDNSGDLVKRLMTLEEIQRIIATSADDSLSFENFSDFFPGKRVDDVVNKVQNVLKEEIETHKMPDSSQFIDSPDVSGSWSMILPAIFGNSGAQINPDRQKISVTTPDTVMIEPTESLTSESINWSEVAVSTPRPTTKNYGSNSYDAITSISKQTSVSEQTSTESTPSQKVTAATIAEISTTKSTTSSSEIENTSDPNPTIDVHEYQEHHTEEDPMKKETNKFEINTEGNPNMEPILNQQTSNFYNEPETSTPLPNTLPSTTKSPNIVLYHSPLTQATKIIMKEDITKAPIVNFPVTDNSMSRTSTFQPAEITTTQLTTSIENQTTHLPITEHTTEVDPQTLSSSESVETSITHVDTMSTNPIIFTQEPTTTTRPYAMVKITSENPTTGTEIPKLSTWRFTYQTAEQTTKTLATQTSSDTLDKLLHSTNVFEINSALSSNTSPYNPPETTTQSQEDIISEIAYVESNTTEPNLLHSVEQMIAQAVGGFEEVFVTNISNRHTDEDFPKPDHQKISEVHLESATIPNLVSVEDPTTHYTLLLEPNRPQDEVVHQINENNQQIGATSNLNVEILTTPSEQSIFSENNTPHDTSTTSMIEGSSQTYQTNIDLTTRGYEETSTSSIKYEETTSTSTSISASTVNGTSSIEQNKRNTLLPVTTRPFSITTSPIEYSTTESYTIALANSPMEPNLATDSTKSDIDKITTSYNDKTSTISSEYITTNGASDFSSTTSTIGADDLKEKYTVTPGGILTSFPSDQGNKSETDKEEWTLLATINPHNENTLHTPIPTFVPILEVTKPIDLMAKPMQGFGLEDSTSKLDADVYQFIQLCNELGFRFWNSVTKGVSSARSVVISPFAAMSLLAMIFLGARGATSGEMNEILKLDNMVTFNPHLIFKNVSESIEVNAESGVAVSAIIRELYSDRSKGKILSFYKERVRQFYDGHVEEVSFKEIGDTIRRRTNLLVKKQTNGKVGEYIKENIKVTPPLAGISASLFETDCSQASTRDRDGEIHFVVLPTIRQRRLVPIPAVVYREGFLAGYEPSLDATAVALGTKNHAVSTIFVIPGRQGVAAVGDSLARLEKRLVDNSFQKGAWSRLLRSLISRPGLEIQIPRFAHRSIINATSGLKHMGLKDLFDLEKADLRGLNGVAHDLHLCDMLQINSFSVCKENKGGESHLSEVYPATPVMYKRLGRELEYDDIPGVNLRTLSDNKISSQDYLFNNSHLPLSLRPRQARIPQVPRLRFDRPFLYFVRHNPTGLLLHMGRFNPKLLP